MFLDTTVKRDFHWPGLAYALRVAVQRGPSANLQKGSSSTARLPGFAIKASRTSTALSPRAPAFTLDNSRMGMARARLSAERKAWRNNHPHVRERHMHRACTPRARAPADRAHTMPKSWPECCAA